MKLDGGGGGESIMNMQFTAIVQHLSAITLIGMIHDIPFLKKSSEFNYCKV